LHIFSFFTSSHRFSKLHHFSATFDDPRVPHEYLLAVTSGRITVVRTKVLVSSSLSISRSNRLAGFGYQFWVLALCVCRSTFASTVTYEYHCMHPKWFSILWYVWRQPCPCLALRLTLSPNRPKWASLGLHHLGVRSGDPKKIC
jgi:hypothetical protein